MFMTVSPSLSRKNVPKLTVCHVPKLTRNVHKLTGHPNVPKNYQCHEYDHRTLIRARLEHFSPFLLAGDGVRVEEVEPWHEGVDTWCVLCAYLQGSVETHSLVQNFYFGGDLMLRRHDYTVNIASGFGGAQLTSKWHLSSEQSSRLHPWTQQPSDPRHDNGRN
jgi:hypothetical protein